MSLPVVFFLSVVATASLLQPAVGISIIHRMNVSQEEYTRSFNTYVKRMREKDYSSSYEKKYFLTFTHSGETMDSLHSRRPLEFKARIGRGARVERATLRGLVSGEGCRELSFYQVSDEGERRQLETIRPLAEFLPQWRGVDAEWSEGSRFEVEGPGCSLHSPVLHLMVERTRRRSPRSTQVRLQAHHRGATDCHPEHFRPTPKKQRCCRHKMDVVFKDLPGYQFILQPKNFDAGYCKGSCPYRYNPANHHASLQGLIYRQKKGAAPKPCCAPSKLEQLDIIHVDEDDSSKLQVVTWSNMKVLECACS